MGAVIALYEALPFVELEKVARVELTVVPKSVCDPIRRTCHRMYCAVGCLVFPSQNYVGAIASVFCSIAKE